MTYLDFLPPDPGLVDRIRQGLHAHQAENGVRDRLAGQTTAPTPTPPAADEVHQPARVTALPPLPRRTTD